LHAPFALAGGLMGVLRAVIQIAMLAMVLTGHELLFRGCVALPLIGRRRVRHIREALEQRAAERLRGDSMAPARHQDIEDMAVDQDGAVLDILVQRQRDKKAAKKFFRKLLKGFTYVPRVILTDKLKSYGAAKREILPGVEHRQHRYLNNRAENSHQPTRQRERRMQRFKSPGHAQRFLSAYGPVAQHFRPRRHLLSASTYRQERRQRFHTWQEITNLPTAA
jgi:transposase-like protein